MTWKQSEWFLHAFDCYQGQKHIYRSKQKKGVSKPKVINFNANDICNSKCTMCYIWKQKRDIEITPEEFAKILTDPLYSEIGHIGITGGEPTMRQDLPALYEAACKTLPNLKGMSAITNAFKPKDVISRLEASAAICHKYGKSFSMMVSLDGYGEVHDRIRGRKGNFETAIQVIEHFKKIGIPVSVGCTITKDNLWDVDELLDFLKEHNIYGRFRVAEFIKRLYNDGITTKIRNFTEDEAYHLALFFKKLELSFETQPQYKRTYQSIRNMLLGGKRQIGCPYHSEGVVLDCRGNIAYCAPKSPMIGNTLEHSALEIFNDNIEVRDKIIDTECSDCIHDYHAPATIAEQKELVNRVFWKSTILKLPQIPVSLLVPKIKKRESSTDAYRVIITGWYGTETVGDKAILGGIIKHYQAKHKNVTFQVTSMYPFVTHRTMQELGMPEIETVPVYGQAFYKQCALANEVVMGGGPLMGMTTLNIPLRAFQVGKKYGAKNTVFGCGIGPVNGAKFEKTILKILKLADEIKLRDKKSAEWAKEKLGSQTQLQVINDPAFEFVQHQSAITHSAGEKKKELACFLRAWPREYAADYGEEVFDEISQKFELDLANTIKHICKELDVIPVFHSMHNFVVGHDDRDFYRQFTKKHFGEENFRIINEPSSVDSIINAMKESEYCLSMRFHSVLFAYVLQTNFFAIDYTNGGKIKSFLDERNMADRMVRLQDFSEQNTSKILEKLRQ